MEEDGVTGQCYSCHTSGNVQPPTGCSILRFYYSHSMGVDLRALFTSVQPAHCLMAVTC